MDYERSVYSLLVLLAGIILGAVGMLGYTGLISWKLPVYVMGAGLVLMVAGIILISLDLRRSEPLAEDCMAADETRSRLSAVPEEGYCIDLTQEPKPEKKRIFYLETREERVTADVCDEPEIIDLTCSADFVPEGSGDTAEEPAVSGDAGAEHMPGTVSELTTAEKKEE